MKIKVTLVRHWKFWKEQKIIELLDEVIVINH